MCFFATDILRCMAVARRNCFFGWYVFGKDKTHITVVHACNFTDGYLQRKLIFLCNIRKPYLLRGHDDGDYITIYFIYFKGFQPCIKGNLRKIMFCFYYIKDFIPFFDYCVHFFLPWCIDKRT